jgi:hypothetical protein
MKRTRYPRLDDQDAERARQNPELNRSPKFNLMLGCLFSFAGLFCLSGCYMYTPHAGHPGMMAPSNMNMLPPQPIPQSTMLLPTDQINQPTIESRPTIEQPVQTFKNDDKVEAPVPSAKRGGTDNKVPEPRDPSPTSRLDETPIRTSETEGSKISRVEDPVFLKPVVVADNQLASNSGIVSASMKGPLSAFEEDGRYARETQYRWLQGKVEYDPQRKSWHLVYDMSPSPDDRLGGEVTLGGRLPFQLKDSNGFFRVYGGFDSSRLDQLAKPIYQTAKVEVLRAR